MVVVVVVLVVVVLVDVVLVDVVVVLEGMGLIGSSRVQG